MKSTVWKVSEAKSRLSEVLNRARRHGPQIIGVRNPCVVGFAGRMERSHGTSYALG